MKINKLKEAVMKKIRTLIITAAALFASTQFAFADAAPVPDTPERSYLGWIAGGAAALVAFIIVKARGKKGTASDSSENKDKAKTQARPKNLKDYSNKSGKF